MQKIERPDGNNREAWRAHWKALGMPSRAERILVALGSARAASSSRNL